jgi:hypothetical protein
MHYVRKEGTGFAVGLNIPWFFFWSRTYEYICDTESQVHNLKAPLHKLIITDKSISNSMIYPKDITGDESIYDCICYNNIHHRGGIRILHGKMDSTMLKREPIQETYINCEFC